MLKVTRIKPYIFSTLLTFIVGLPAHGYSQDNNDPIIIERNGYTLTLVDSAKTSNDIKDRLIICFFNSFEKMHSEFSPNSGPKSATVSIIPSYNGIAATTGTSIVISSNYINQHPWDTDVITHELMHVVQNYGANKCPSWAVEGLADYVRYKYGTYNNEAGWSLPDFEMGQKYTNSYRVTARFFIWLEKHCCKSILLQLDNTMRNDVYNDMFWMDNAGVSIDDLWKIYEENP